MSCDHEYDELVATFNKTNKNAFLNKQCVGYRNTIGDSKIASDLDENEENDEE